ncbi:glycosyltransferase family 2 protein [Kaistia terrae]|uniref:Glycosyltransferase family 2 protein n=1 Tax=Kaistia terrae TaxID=537017 RepID=A0ABW0Q350_9HYPH|nr:glycosyltransferase family A protein [Kaistia terrae]MCX5578956.1 glycosyltransferase family A protein [Kaistia terrae]
MAIEISAILTTFNRAEFLPLVLDALVNQTLARDKFEVIVVNDGSSDDTLSILDRYRNILPIKCFTLRHSGIATVKNIGVFAAQAPIVVFLDDDDTLHPNALRAHFHAHQTHSEPRQAILGHTNLAPEVTKSPVMDYVVNRAGLLFSYSNLSSSRQYGWREFWGGRSSCKRSFLVENGMFTPEFHFGYEDIECGWRLNSLGLEVFYEPAAQSTMVRSVTFDGFCTRSYRQGVAAHHFHRLHPVSIIRDYLQIEETIALWERCWRDYGYILRTARQADQSAREALDSDPAENDRLGMLYDSSFRLSFAKGFQDAASLAEGRPQRKQVGYGLPGR